VYLLHIVLLIQQQGASSEEERCLDFIQTHGSLYPKTSFPENSEQLLQSN